MTKLPPYLTWHQALNFMVTGEPLDADLLVFGAAPATLDRARGELLDRLATGEAVAIGQRCTAIGVNGFTTQSFHSPIEPPTAWINLEIDDATSDATISRFAASIPGQGYADVRLRRADVIAAREAVLSEQRAEQQTLAGLLAPDPAPRPIAGAAAGKAYKEELIASAVEFFDHDGDWRQAKVARWLVSRASRLDEEGLSESAAKRWAGKVAARLEEQRRRL